MKLVSKRNFLLVLVVAVFLAMAISLTMSSQQKEKESSMTIKDTNMLDEVEESDAELMEKAPEDADNLESSL